jgi:hypothetical protein
MELFCLITEKTGWTIEEIGKLTLLNIKDMLDVWTGKKKSKEKSSSSQKVKQFVEMLKKTK